MTSNLPKDLEERLEKVAKHLGVTKQYCIEQAILFYVEDQEDLLLAKKIMAEDNGTRYTLDEVEKVINKNDDERS